jgi:hypothetical protein
MPTTRSSGGSIINANGGTGTGREWNNFHNKWNIQKGGEAIRIDAGA